MPAGGHTRDGGRAGLMAPRRQNDERRLQRELEGLVRALTRDGGIESLIERKLSALESQMEGMLERTFSQLLVQMLGGGGEALGGLLGLPRLAAGGVVDGAQVLALGGEAGPEAVLPLTRLADGSLGVRSEAGARPVIINLTLGGAPEDAADSLSSSLSSPAVAAALSRALDEALDQAVAERVRTQLRDGGLLAGGEGV